MKKQKRIDNAIECLEYMEEAWRTPWSGPLEDQIEDILDVLRTGEFTSEDFRQRWLDDVFIGDD